MSRWRTAAVVNRSVRRIIDSNVAWLPGVVFAFDANGGMGSRRYANLEENLSGPQATNFAETRAEPARLEPP